MSSTTAQRQGRKIALGYDNPSAPADQRPPMLGETPLDLRPTTRGFLRTEFLDRNGTVCRLQESSLADEAAIWLGTDQGCMRLTQRHVEALLPLLHRFVTEGHLRDA